MTTTVFFVMLCLMAQEPDAEVVTVEPLRLEEFQPKFALAERLFREADDPSQAIVLFDEIVQGLYHQTDLTEVEQYMVLESLKYLGILEFPDKTEDRFIAMIQLNPNYELPAGNISPKFIQTFRRLREEKVGFLELNLFTLVDGVEVSLNAAKLFADGRFIGEWVAGKPVSLLIGSRRMQVSLPNYHTEEFDVVVERGVKTQFTLTMERNAAEVRLITIPSGVELVLNGEPFGRSKGQASPEYQPWFDSHGLSLEQGSEELVISGLQPGIYDLLLRAPCFLEKKIQLDLDALKTFRFEPVVMEKGQATISVSSPAQSPGIAYLDDLRLGRLPVQEMNVCPGQYTLKVTFPEGVWQKEVQLTHGSMEQFSARPQPTLVWLGIDELEGEAPKEPVAQWFQQLNQWNVLSNQSGPYTGMDLSNRLLSLEPLDPDTQNTLRSLPGDLFVAARVIRKKEIVRFLRLAFATPLTKKVLHFDFDFRKMERSKEFIAQLDVMPLVVVPWLGLQAVSMENREGLEVVSLNPHGPAQAILGSLPLQITAVNGQLVRRLSDLQPLDLSPIKVQTAVSTYTVTPTNVIAEVPFNEKTACPLSVLVHLKFLSEFDPDPLLAQSALFNLARFHFYLGDFQVAFDLFSEFNPPIQYGISRGTAVFYQALCFEKLNLQQEANRSLLEAMNDKDARLWHVDGPFVAEWAGILVGP